LVKGMRVAGVKTIEQANQYLEEEYLVWWERELTVEPANSDDAHRKLDKSHNLAASLSQVETRQVRNDYTIRIDSEFYQIEHSSIAAGLRKANVRVEKRLDASIAIRFQERYLTVRLCVEKPSPAAVEAKSPPRRPTKRGSDWNKNFDLKDAPPIWRAAKSSGRKRDEND
jgi:ribosomal protein L20